MRSLAAGLGLLVVLVSTGACDEDDPLANIFTPPAPPPPPPCVPKTCLTAGAECGSTSDGCGGNLTCAACPSGKVCTDNHCVIGCVQSCPAPSTCSAEGTCVLDGNPELSFREDVRWMSFEVRLDGALPPAPCKLAELELVDPVAQRIANLRLTCKDGKWLATGPVPVEALRAIDYQASLKNISLVGYEPELLRATLSVPKGNASLWVTEQAALGLAEGSDGVLQLTAAAGARVTGDFQVNGAPPTKSAACAGSPDTVLARATFGSKTAGVRIEKLYTCSSPDWSFALDLVPGSYDVTIAPTAEATRYLGVNLMPIEVTFAGKIAPAGASSFGHLDEANGVHLGAALRVNGSAVPAPPASLCNGSLLASSYTFASIQIMNQAKGVAADVPLGCDSNWMFDVVLPAATYALRYVPGMPGVRELPQVAVDLPSVTLSQNTNRVLDLAATDATFSFLVDNDTFDKLDFCQNNPDGLVGDLVFRDATGAQRQLPARCAGALFFPSARLAEGTYTLALRPREDMDTGLGKGSSVYVFPPVAVGGSQNRYRLVTKRVPLRVDVTVDGLRAKIDAVAIKDPSEQVAYVSATERVTGVRAVLPITPTTGPSVVLGVSQGTWDVQYEPRYLPEPGGTTLPRFPLSKSGVVVFSSLTVPLDARALRLTGPILFGGAAVAFKEKDCIDRFGTDPRYLETTFVEGTTQLRFTTRQTCASPYRIDELLPAGTWDIYVRGSSPDGASFTPFADYDYQVARKLVIGGGGRSR